jgi:hypothetical protein
MDKEMLMMMFVMANYQQNIYLNQPMEEMLELEKNQQIRMKISFN